MNHSLLCHRCIAKCVKRHPQEPAVPGCRGERRGGPALLRAAEAGQGRASHLHAAQHPAPKAGR
jgi:hypothetical protein